MSDDAAKHYKVEILQDNLYVRNMTLNDDVMSAIEKILLSSPASFSESFKVKMDSYYENQATSLPHFSGHYRQRGSGFGALAAGIGRVALPLLL